jgi:four helix bundle protein
MLQRATRRNNKEFARFLDIARASAVEVQSMLYLALDIGYVDEPEFKRLYGLAADAIALITALTGYLRKALVSKGE